MHILWCMGSKFCLKFQRVPLKFHTNFSTHTPQNMHFTVFYFCVWVTISLNCEAISLSETGPSYIGILCEYDYCVSIPTSSQCQGSQGISFMLLFHILSVSDSRNPAVFPIIWSPSIWVYNPRTIMNEIKNDAWSTVNNDFLVTSGVICQWFSRVTKSRVKIIGKSPHEWPKNRYSR